MGGGRDRVAPRGRSPRGEPPERAGAGRRAEGATTRARGGGCDAVAVAAGGTARRGGFAGASKEAGMGNVDRPGRSCRQDSPGRSAHRGPHRHCHLRAGPSETGQALQRAAIGRDRCRRPLRSRHGPPANAGNRKWGAGVEGGAREVATSAPIALRERLRVVVDPQGVASAVPIGRASVDTARGSSPVWAETRGRGSGRHGRLEPRSRPA